MRYVALSISIKGERPPLDAQTVWIFARDTAFSPEAVRRFIDANPALFKKEWEGVHISQVVDLESGNVLAELDLCLMPPAPIEWSVRQLMSWHSFSRFCKWAHARSSLPVGWYYAGHLAT